MAKRINSSSINWSALQTVFRDAENKEILTRFKAKSDKFLRDVTSKPAELPKIDWNYYKTRIAVPGMVDAFKSSYETINIPYPSDQGLLAKIDNDEVKWKNESKKENVKIDKQIQECQEKLKALEAILPYSEMNMEEIFVYAPHMSIDVNKPTLWPKSLEDENEMVPMPPPAAH